MGERGHHALDGGLIDFLVRRAGQAAVAGQRARRSSTLRIERRRGEHAVDEGAERRPPGRDGRSVDPHGDDGGERLLAMGRARAA